MARIAADGRRGWKNGIRSDDAVRSFRSRHREITYKKVEDKNASKLRAENRDHVGTFFIALKQIEILHPGLVKDPDRVWNVDETKVDATEAGFRKAFCASSGHHGGFSATSSTSGVDKHITAVVAVSASGRKSTPFFIVAGQRHMSKWTDALLNTTASSSISPALKQYDKYVKPEWFPNDGFVKMTTNGSMEMSILPALMKHIDKAVRRVVPAEVPYVLTLDGNSSRNATE